MTTESHTYTTTRDAITMSDVDRSELATLLRETLPYLDRPETDVAWTQFSSADDLRNEVRELLQRIEAPGSLSQNERVRLLQLFAPTAALQDVSMNNGWHDDYRALATRFDQIVRNE